MEAAMLDVTTQLPLVETETPDPDSKPCEQCGKPFVPRSRSGGSPQRFCSQDCRRAFSDAADQRPASVPASASVEPASAPASGQLLASVPPATPKEDRFDWASDEVVVLREQPATAIYHNPAGGLVIRQRSPYWDDDDDPFICVNAELIDGFLDRLLEICGRGRRK
jgi:hypothetical protein